MKNVRRILAMLLVVLLAGNCFISVQASPEEEGTALTDVSESTLNGETEVAVEVENETEEGNGEGEEKIPLLIQLEELESELTDMEFVYGSTPIGSMEFESDALKCKDEDDELPEDVSLSLIADIQYICTETDEEIANKTSSSYTQAGKYKLELSNFRLSGDNAEEYLLEVETDYIYTKENVTVKQKLIKIEPASTTVEYHGQYLSGTADYSDQILSGDTVDISATYAYGSVNRIITLESCTCSNSNYKVELKADMRVEYEKTNYTIDVKAKDENPQVRYETIEEEGESREYAIYEGIEEFNLVAPQNYLISSGGTIEAGWSAKLTERFSPDANPPIQYYLRNNNPASSNYGAIGQQNVYRYKVFNDAPTDMKAYIIAGKYYNSTDAVYVNNDAQIFLEVTGEEIKQSVSFHWKEKDKDGNTVDKIAEDADITYEIRDGKYVYKYIIDVVSEMQYLNFYASNTNGSCNKVEKFEIGNETAKSSKIIIDKDAPSVNNIYVDYDNQKQKATATIKIDEIVSGIKSIQYAWDINKEYNDKEKNEAEEDERKHSNVGFSGNGYTTDLIELSKAHKESNREYFGSKTNSDSEKVSIEIELAYGDSIWTNDNNHRLTLVITDIAGNVTTAGHTPPEGIDFEKPQFNSVVIAQNPNAAEGAVLNIKDYGTFSNAPIDVILTAQDMPEGIVVSGIDKVALAGKIQKSDDGKKLYPELGKSSPEEYTFTFNTGRNDDLKAEVWDRQKSYFAATISDISENKYSNTLVVDAAAPKWEMKYNNQKDDNYEIKEIGTDVQRWYGKDDEDASLYYYITDELSGLEGYLIANGFEGDTVLGTELYIKPSDDNNQIENTVCREFHIGDLGNGKHVISLFARDNASNLFVPETDGQSVNRYAFVKDIRYIDLEEPRGNAEVRVNGAEIEIGAGGETSWIPGSSDVEINVHADDYVSGVKEVEIAVYSKDDEELVKILHPAREINSDVIGSSELFTHRISKDILAKNTRVKVCVSIKDYAGNRVELEDILLNRDVEFPEIDEFYLIDSDNKKQVVKSYPMGICANDTVRLGVVAHDGLGDSGIKKVVLSCTEVIESNGEVTDGTVEVLPPVTKNYEFTLVDEKEKDGIIYGEYEIELTLAEAESFYNWEVYAVASDYMNNESDSSTTLIQATNGNTNRLFIEDIEPDAQIELLEPKYLNETDNTYWYDAAGGKAKITVSDAQSGLSIRDLKLSLDGEEIEIQESDVEKIQEESQEEKQGESKNKKAIILKELSDDKVIDPDRTEYSGKINLLDLAKKIQKDSGKDDDGRQDKPGSDEEDKEEGSDSGNNDSDDEKESSEIKIENSDSPTEEITGEYTLKYTALDNAGNETHVEQKYNIDATAPQIVSLDLVFRDDSTLNLASNGFVSTFERLYQYFRRDKIKLKIKIEDPGVSSGIKSIYYEYEGYAVDQNSNVERIATEEGAPIRVDVTSFENNEFIIDFIDMFGSKDFRGFVSLTIVDNVGNTCTTKIIQTWIADGVEQTYEGDLGGFVYDTKEIDVDIPALPDQGYRDENGNKLFTKDVLIDVRVSDATSGVATIAEGVFDENNKPEMPDKTIGSQWVVKVGDDRSGWKVEEADRNLPLSVTKRFTFNEEGNDIYLEIQARDNSGNMRITDYSAHFTIDKTAPVANVTFREDSDEDLYYNADRIADITIKERNFDAKRMTAAITNTFGDIPSITYTKKSVDEYTATIVFDEGDYTFDYSGTDRGDHQAKVTFAGGNEKKFYVDKTKPVITDNFATFVNVPTKNNFNTDKVARITIEEHNFSPELVNITIMRKDAGALHSSDGFTNATNVLLKDKAWTSNGDTHTLEFTLADDAVYQIHVSAKDLAGNDAESRTSAIFEIDKTAPVIVARDSVAVKADNVEFVDIYPYTREKDPAPTIEFDDINFAYLRYNLTKYSPKEDASGATKMDPVTVFAPEDEKQNGKINNKIFTLPDFVEDGVYTLEVSAVDDAGNESLLNNNTYIRIVEHDVIAYIMDSNIAAGTGLYSFQYENGDAISKRPDNFMDLRICVITALESQAEVVLRDTNGKEYPTNAKARTNSSIYGVQEYYFDVNSSFFKETFQDDTDIELFLTVKNEENRIDLGKMHIDNIAPKCEMPKGFKPWHWYYGKEDRTITLTGINELLDVELCKVFDNGKEIAFDYSAENNTLEFTIGKGWHSVGLVLTDVAGNTYNVQELRNIHVGFFWLWIIISASVVAVITGVTGTIFFVRKRSQDNF